MARIGIAEEARHSSARWLEGLARVGFVAKGLLYATVGIVAVIAGLGGRADTTDTRGAMSSVMTLPLGRPLLILMAAGLAGYAIWRVAEGVFDPDDRGSDAKALAVRASFVVRGVLHLGLALTAAAIARVIRVAPGSSGEAGGNGGDPREATATAFELPGGQWIVLAIAIGVGGFGLYQLYRAVKPRFSRHVDQAHAERELGAWIVAVSRIGIGARGLVFLAAGWLFVTAAVSRDASRTGGIERALDVFRNMGRWPLLAIGAGLVAYAVYQLLSARYRRIRVG